MKRLLNIFVILSVGIFVVGCSPEQEKQAAADIPALAPTTQAVERIEQKVDTIVAKTAPIVATGQQAADTATSLGVPYAQYAKWGLEAVGALMLGYQTIRKGQSDTAASIMASTLTNIGAPPAQAASNALAHAQSVAPSLTLPTAVSPATA